MSPAATARLFAAVDPPPAVCRELASWARAVSGSLRAGGAWPVAEGATVRLLDPGTMHVTLCFLGVRPVEEIEALGGALDSCASEAGELSLGAPLWLPPSNPRSLALEIHEREGRLGRLQQELSRAFALAVDWEPERRRFKAHVTVARLGRGKQGARRGARGRRRGRAGGGMGEGAEAAAEAGAQAPPAPTPQLSFVPAAVVLYRSWLSPQGASYEPVATCALTGAASSSSSTSSLEGEEGAGAP
ncbi:MAG TPA: RNA 2',3'-cyclic phosphodiesterase [Solirubrobacteraceae bacterium]|jgi:2'-5' RNA ligase|nr:RNA 2',3'-cyclic phosphodiesterase [Solirubrobacteraceae bacterium]